MGKAEQKKPMSQGKFPSCLKCFLKGEVVTVGETEGKRAITPEGE